MLLQPKRLFSLLIVSILLISQGCQTEEHRKNSYQNVVFIISDDHSYEVLGAYGNDVISTPNLDRLAREGIRFTNAYSNSPICSASRQSLLTGKYPHSTGVNLLFTPFSDDNNTTIAEHLLDHGYKTALFGKTHFNDWIWGPLYKDGYPDYGFQVLDAGHTYKEYMKSGRGKAIPDSIVTYNRAKKNKSIAYRWNAGKLPAPCYDADCEGTFLANQAVEFIKNSQDEKFCLWLAFHEPHMPFSFPVEYRNKYLPKDMPLPQGSSEDDRWIPEIFRNLTEEEKRGIIASYYTSVEYMDKNTGIVLKALDSLNLAEKTLVVYLGDQGYLLNDHKRFEKHTMWAESVKAPLIIRGKENTGKVTDALVEFVDIVPTVVEALGVKPLQEVQGKSFLPIIHTDVNDHRELVFSEYLEDNKAMVANKTWKYIFTTGKRDLGLGYATGFGPSGIYHRLYNLNKDPQESTNLAYHEDYQDILLHLQKQMLERFINTHPDAENLPESLTLTGKLVWFCEPRDIGAEYGETPLRVFENTSNH